MESRDITLVVEVARLGSFAAAARALDVDPSVVSRAVARVEAEIGTRLFYRSTRSLAPTAAGADFIARAAAIDAALGEAVAAARAGRTEISGRLTLTASVGFSQLCLMPVLPDFLHRHPGLQVRLLASDTPLDLFAEGVDLALRMSPAVTGAYIVSKLCDLRYRVVASPGFAARHELAAPAAVSGVNCLLFNLPSYNAQWLFRDRSGTRIPVPVRGNFESTSALAIRDLALAGAGVALMAERFVAPDIAAGRLVDLFPDHEVTATDFSSAVWLVYPDRTFLPAGTRAAIDFFRETLGN